MKTSTSRLKPFALPIRACCLGALLMFLAPAAQASWNYRYFEGESYANNLWRSATGTDSGGRVYTGMGAAEYGFSNYQYTASYDAATGYWISAASGDTGSWTNNWSSLHYSAFQECWWNSNYSNPGQPVMTCEQFRD
ncbi:hypothetical protein [Paenarthrobacter sp. YJN-5]|uniref:hypothetical protein n=1 Tax=Paenarthrobacter sp. YJN-5 TaxID=2735316 RepID=UPI001878C5B2|nr:hypothetical protein [Paenarthrobacter sp. YJN-5]QOT15653.1 hypothetical protein HMI59_02990 [Paenarthrobacter sp. YJN-5]